MPTNKLLFTREAESNLAALEADKGLAKRLKAVKKTLGLMEMDLRHRSLQTRKYDSLAGKDGEEVFEAYAENKTPGAYRVFWHYGPGKNVVTIIAITPHP
ncbi:hypothetical protein [Corallococcus sp. 4LFB]|uniref:hypothetical protein n=1 Tax=Corallococcus sp. 4LFB TaxID=3383249 RepID=UPI00397701A2